MTGSLGANEVVSQSSRQPKFNTLKPRDGFYWQQQIILRNSSTSATAFWDFLRTSWSWRSLAKRPYLRTLPFTAGTLLYTVGFILGGIFSSQLIETSGIEVLIQSPFCGDWQDASLNESEPIFANRLNVASCCNAGISYVVVLV